MTKYIQFGTRRIDYQLVFSDRKTLGIKVTPEMEVIVTAPDGAALERIEDVLRRRAPWILRQQSHFLSFYPKTPQRRYVSGETHLYLGRRYQLRLVQTAVEGVRMKGRFIEVATSDHSKVRTLLEDWYLRRAKTQLIAIATQLSQKFARHGVQPSEIVLRSMPTRWGSCTPRGKIILNPELIKAPRPCIEYVVTHELCHLVYLDHTQKFLDLQSKVMPSWEKWKRRLEEFLA